MREIKKQDTFSLWREIKSGFGGKVRLGREWEGKEAVVGMYYIREEKKTSCICKYQKFVSQWSP